MFKRIWQWIVNKFHNFYADMTPQEHQKLLTSNQAYADQQYQLAQEEWAEAGKRRTKYLANLKEQREMLNFNYEEGRPNKNE